MDHCSAPGGVNSIDPFFHSFSQLLINPYTMFKLKQLSRSNSLRVTKSNRLISAASSVAPDSPMALPELMKNATYKVEVEKGIRAVRLASKLCQVGILPASVPIRHPHISCMSGA